MDDGSSRGGGPHWPNLNNKPLVAGDHAIAPCQQEIMSFLPHLREAVVKNTLKNTLDHTEAIGQPVGRS